ncbi:MAG: VCBS repeat-containing protein [Candidatus Poribacteria bacterium]|nr:VCBS repeat-containing protein [Candidatus Poribacteria bacterium]
MKQTGVWVTRGFEDFSKGTCGNAGQNLYISRAGVLQRIHQYDFNKDGYVDLIFCNSQNHWERPPTYVYQDALGDTTRIELPSEGAWSGAVADLNGDGYDDLILGMWNNGIRSDLNAIIYYGSPDGLSERRQHQLPAPLCTSVAAGDFNGDGKPDLAFLSQSRVRLFYQSELGFEPKRFIDLDIEGAQLSAADLDGDGYTDLIVRSKDGRVSVYWGGAEGLDPVRITDVPVEQVTAPSDSEIREQERYAEYVAEATPLAQVIDLDGRPHLFVPQPERVFLVPVAPNRRFGSPLVLDCPQAIAIATGDVNGDGYTDLVLACRQPWDEEECSWIYWGSDRGFDETRRARLKSFRACDVVVADLDGDGCDDIVLCQSHTDASYTADSFVYRGARDGVIGEPVRLRSHDARRVLVARPSADRRPQVIFVNFYSRNRLGNIKPSIYFGGPDGFSPERRRDVPGWGAVEAICCDINDDGDVDLVLANASENSVDHDPGSYILLNGPDGFPDAPTWTLPTTRAHGVCCADLNRDGYLDLIFCGFDNPELLIFYGTPDGFDADNPTRIRLEHDGTVYKEPRWIYLADLNNNGWLDLVVPQITYDRSFILWGGPEGFSMERCQVLSVVRAACVRAADLTGSGYLDLIVGGHMPNREGPHDSFVYIYWNGPNGLREDRRTLLPANAINAMAVADFNNDGLLDLFICSYHDGRVRDIDSYIYWNRKGSGFSAADRLRLFTHSASGCVAADFNADGFIDLAIAYHKVNGDHIGNSAVWWNGPDGFVEGRVTRLPTSGPHGMVAVGPGNIMDRGPEEYYVSSPFKLPHGTAVTGISWEAELSPKTWVKAQLRFADSQEGLTEAAWVGPSDGSGWFDNRQTVRREASRLAGWVQYRLALGAENSGSTPRVTEVDLYYGERE